MSLIADTKNLAALCEKWRQADYLTVDTEFLRDKTYYAKLCLIQVSDGTEAVAIDTLAKGLDISPFYEILHGGPLKVFHAARQDLEIFFQATGKVPHPIFDTQIAAMVCGFGESVGYETLVGRLLNKRIDKTTRFTDWSRRPLNKRQLDYALSDVIHLRPIYEYLRGKLEKRNRLNWIGEEMAVLTSEDTYRVDPKYAWKRIKSRIRKPRAIALLQCLAEWRETKAQQRNVPRNRIVRDDALVEIASNPPRDRDGFNRMRMVPKGFGRSDFADEILHLIDDVNNLPKEALPDTPDFKPTAAEKPGTVLELLKVLLKIRCQEEEIAPKLIATTADLETIAMEEDPDVPALHGWRFDLFGCDALALKNGTLALSAKGSDAVIQRS